MGQYRKKPVVIEAFRWTGDVHQTEQFVWILSALEKPPSEVGHARIIGGVHGYPLKMVINTLEGRVEAGVGDWIIKGIAGEIYPCRDDIFKATYDAVEA